MNPVKFIWSTFFRLFPCPTKVGLRRIGNPSRNSPVLVTCNFYLTVKGLVRKLRGLDAWLLVGDSKGVNVWCAAAGDEFNTRSVVSAIKTSGIADLVDHRSLILPPLGAPGIRAKDVRDQTGWSIHWGPVRAKDIPQFLQVGLKRSEKMKRVTYNWGERLYTALGSVFPFYFLGAIGFFIFGQHLLGNYMIIGVTAFLFFMLTCPWLPGKRGWTKAIFLDVILATILILYHILDFQSTLPIRANLTMAMVFFLLFGTECGGLGSTTPSDLDPFLTRLGIGTIGRLSFAGTIRTDLLNNFRKLKYYHGLCTGCRSCDEICPQGVWRIGDDKRAVFLHKEKCTACGACIIQCEGGAIKAEPVPNDDSSSHP